HLRLPELNTERRQELVKLAHKYAETAKVAVRHVRRDGMDILKKLEKDHTISQDEHKRMDTEVQKATDQTIADIDQMLGTKEKEILTADPPRHAHHPAPIVAVRGAPACRHHQGRQWPVGVGARLAARRGPPPWRRSAAQDRAGRGRNGHLLSDDLLVQ